MSSVKQPRKIARVALFYARSGPKRGRPECEVVFATKSEAVSFLTNLHGLSVEEARTLNRDMALALKLKWHGAEKCSIQEIEVSAAKARREIATG